MVMILTLFLGSNSEKPGYATQISFYPFCRGSFVGSRRHLSHTSTRFFVCRESNRARSSAAWTTRVGWAELPLVALHGILTQVQCPIPAYPHNAS